MSEVNAHQYEGQYLTFILEDQYYAVPIGSVREINQMSEITPVPKTPTFVVGVMNLRGNVIPVVDLRVKFQVTAADYTRETCIIVIEGETGQVGMIVDSVREVVNLESKQIEPRPHMGSETEMSFVMGMGKVEERVLILIDIVYALSKDNLSQYVGAQPGNADSAA